MNIDKHDKAALYDLYNAGAISATKMSGLTRPPPPDGLPTRRESAAETRPEETALRAETWRTTVATLQAQMQRAHAAAAAVQHPETADGAPDYTPAGRHADGTCEGTERGHLTRRAGCAYCLQYAAWEYAARSAPPTQTAAPPPCGKMGSPTAERFATALRGRMDFGDA